MKFAVLFSGQGAQKAGMGLDLLADSLFAETIDEASSASGQNIVADFKGENDELKKIFFKGVERRFFVKQKFKSD